MTRAELLALAKEAVAAQRVAAPLVGRLADALLASLVGAPIDPEHHPIFDPELLELLGEISGHGSAASRLRGLLQGPVLLISEMLPRIIRQRTAAALLAGTERAMDACTCSVCAAERAAATATVEASVQRARKAAQRPTG